MFDSVPTLLNAPSSITVSLSTSTEYLQQSADNGNTAAQNAIKAINENRNAMITTSIIDLFYYASNIIDDSTDEQHSGYDGIDSRLKREIREKKNAMKQQM